MVEHGLEGDPAVTLRLGVDIDGVVCDFRGGYREMLVADGWPAARMPDCSDWNFYTRWGIPESVFLRHCDEGLVFSRGLPIPGAREMLRTLVRAGWEIELVTARPAHVRGITEDWLAAHGVPYDVLHFAADKDTIRADLYLDDKPAHVEALREAGFPAVIFNQPWNQDVDGPRMFGWGDVGVLLRIPCGT